MRSAIELINVRVGVGIPLDMEVSDADLAASVVSLEHLLDDASRKELLASLRIAVQFYKGPKYLEKQFGARATALKLLKNISTTADRLDRLLDEIDPRFLVGMSLASQPEGKTLHDDEFNFLKFTHEVRCISAAAREMSKVGPRPEGAQRNVLLRQPVWVVATQLRKLTGLSVETAKSQNSIREHRLTGNAAQAVRAFFKILDPHVSENALASAFESFNKQNPQPSPAR